MSVFSKVRNFFSRHRNKFIVGGVIIGGSIFLTRYAQQKLREWQEKEALEFLDRNRKHQHFESIGRTCNQTILNLALALNETISKNINTEEVIERLKTNPENKLALWNELKVLVFNKAACTIYANVMLVVTLKIQLSIIGGYLYKDPTSLSSEMQERYLSLCQNLMDAGFSRLSRLVETNCRKVLEPVNLTKQLKLSDLEALFWSIQTAVATHNDNPVENLRQYVLPELPVSDGIYEKMVKETAELLNSDEVKALVTHCTTRGFMVLAEQLSEFYTSNGVKENGKLPEGDEFTNPFNVKKPMAKVLPIMNGLFSKKSLPDQFLQQLIVYEKLQLLSANVYESFLS
ncbi:peroxisomal biogenesis factor 3 [Tribolium castaneum]|uniref:Peroxisomal biogenesis factor 3 n=1 Tax=Tribolium castaneum TaxID=7070 RepID=D6WI62_TRICA|nr:PREDICTED: peroxisomal biogenesis factor 3 [Tribolium castaneum]EFA00035.1 Peroxisomal biogenesis factor 3-like Protein [Tribolium castaneum]|eukprot:XP_970039.1 PREDICTED: peroxisomal biogenesis factor 3 [Tribolium castaneum]